MMSLKSYGEENKMPTVSKHQLLKEVSVGKVVLY